MKKSFLLLCLSLMALAAYSQTEYSLDSQTAKEIHQQQEKAEMPPIMSGVEGMIISRQFILEVNFMSDQTRNLLNTAARIEVSTTLNYIAVSLDKIVLQLETNSYQTSNWPFNSFPSNGIISKYELKNLTKQNQGFILRFHTEGRVGSSDITVNVSESGAATLKMESNNGISLNFQGALIPLGQSRIKPVFI
jgi:hypothetical protein